MTESEIAEVCRDKDFPGLFADFASLGQYVDFLASRSSRIIPGKLKRDNFSIPVELDIEQGKCYIRGENGREFCGIHGFSRIYLGSETYSVSCVLRRGDAELLDARTVQLTVELLAKSKQLPPVQKVFHLR